METFLGGKVALHCGDNREILKSIADDSIDSIVCDPPYHLVSIAQRFGSDDATPAQFGSDGRFQRLSGGFMNAKWDSPDEIPPIDPGFAHWLAGFIDGEGCFSVHKKNVNGCETYDCQFSITLRQDDAVIVSEIQRQLGGIGSIALRPASGKGNDKPQIRYCISSQKDCARLQAILSVFPLRAKKARDFEIWSEALDAWIGHKQKSSWEDVAYFRDALMAVKKFGSNYHPSQLFFYRWARQCLRVLKPGGQLVAFGGTRTFHRLACAIEDAGFEIRDQLAWVFGQGFPKSHDIGNGWGTALKPAWEPICLARKPLSEGTVAANVLRWGTGAINIDGCRVPTSDNLNGGAYSGGSKNLADATSYATGVNAGKFVQPEGRWPANIIHDGSEEVLAAFPDAPGQQFYVGPEHGEKIPLNTYGKFGARIPTEPRGDSGSAARFFYTAKADSDDRLGSKHPTVKPVDLMQWLVRLVTPRGGLCLDPFAGTGTTAEAAFREGMRCVLIERENEYQADIRRRMALVLSGPDERARESIKARLNGSTPDYGPLFNGVCE